MLPIPARKTLSDTNVYCIFKRDFIILNRNKSNITSTNLDLIIFVWW